MVCNRTSGKVIESATLSMPAVVTPALAAVETEALRTDWALKIVAGFPHYGS